MLRMVENGDGSVYGMMTPTLPLLRRERSQLSQVLVSKAPEARECGTEIGPRVVPLARPCLLVVPGDRRLRLVAHSPHAPQSVLLGITQVADHLNDRPVLVATAKGAGT